MGADHISRISAEVDHVLGDAREKLIAKIDDLEKERSQIDKELRRVRHALQALGKAVPVLESETHILEDGLKKTPRRRRNRDGSPSLSEKIRDVAVRAIVEAGRPLSRTQVLQALAREGIEVNSDDPGKFVGRVLWRSPLFINEGDGYRLKHR